MRCVLHIGTAKTGTTSIQEMMHVNRERLARAGVWYSRAVAARNHGWLLACCARVERRMPGVHLRRGLHTQADRAAFTERARAALFAEVEEARGRGCHTLVLSAEGCWSILLPEEMARLMDLLSAFDALRVLVMLRRQDHAAVSMYTQSLRGGSVDRDLLAGHYPGAHVRAPDHLDYHARLALWASAVGWGAIEVIPLDDGAGYDSRELFRGRLGLDGRDLAPAVVKNPGLTPLGQEVLRRVNLALPAVVGGRVNADRRALVRAVNAAFPGRGRRPSRAVARAFVARHEEGNRALSAASGVDVTGAFDFGWGAFPEVEETALPRPEDLPEPLRAALRAHGLDPEALLGEHA